MDDVQVECIHDHGKRLQHRDPDCTNIQVHERHLLGFHRLAIMNPTDLGDQPIIQDLTCLICTGEIYNYKQLVENLDMSLESLPLDVAVIPELLQKSASLTKGFAVLMAILRLSCSIEMRIIQK